MATINYITLQIPDILFKHIELIQETPHFNVYRYAFKPGVIFRIPHGLKTGDLVHCFMEHEVNLSNTLRTGTLTMKVQCTFVPVHMGLFSGFEHLDGDYQTDWQDENYGYDRFVPDYKSPDNSMNVVPLPIGIKSNLYEYLNEILFQHTDDVDLLSKYAVNLGCQKDTIRKVVYKPYPKFDSVTAPMHSRMAHKSTVDFFEGCRESSVNLLPQNTTKQAGKAYLAQNTLQRSNVPQTIQKNCHPDGHNAPKPGTQFELFQLYYLSR